MPRAIILSLICCLSVALSSHTMAREPAAPTPVQDADAVAQITDLVMRYAVHRDAGEAQAYADLFTLAHQARDDKAQRKWWRAYLRRFPHGRFADDSRAGFAGGLLVALLLGTRRRRRRDALTRRAR